MQDLLNTFGLEWPKFLAQLILFIIVYFVLKKFAFGPIIAMLEERRKLIEEGQLNAKKIKKQRLVRPQRQGWFYLPCLDEEPGYPGLRIQQQANNRHL